NSVVSFSHSVSSFGPFDRFVFSSKQGYAIFHLPSSTTFDTSSERSSLEFFETTCNDRNIRTPSDLCYLARLYEWMGRIDDALELLEEAEELNPDFWEPPYNLGVIHWRQNNFDGALPTLLRASELAPWRRQPWFILSKIYEQLGRSEELSSAKSRIESLDRELEQLYEHD
ncbi:MAG: tetratricopeptide repeat protein, partial [Acidobacteria bacterium]|nr:tetratricopeptide repeat protein [Acidobacteriota bacterium]